MRHRVLGALAAVFLVSACAAPQSGVGPSGFNDPYEQQNRRVHAFNRGLDRGLVRPSAQAYGNVVPDDAQLAVGNFAANLSEPGDAVNHLLQGDLKGAAHNTVRFLTNTVLGFAGLFDPATDLGVAENSTDFGETLHVWGAGEGAYVELPVLGPSTTRDATGTAVDFVLNPLRYVVGTHERGYLAGARVADGLGRRDRFSDTIDSILYDSADSYAQARLIYLQNRRFALGQADSQTEIDPFALNTEGF